MAVEEFFYHGIEYVHPVRELVVDTGRGVLYINSITDGHTILRVCRIPFEIIDAPKTAVIDLLTVTPNINRRIGLEQKITPVFVQVIEGSTITVESESGEVLWQFNNVPDVTIHFLTHGSFADITIGRTKKEKSLYDKMHDGTVTDAESEAESETKPEPEE
jgi:hypothetical protein